MKSDELDWQGGSVVFWDLGAIDDRSVREQLDELKEDLAQVSYPGDVLLDVGFYPAFSPNGNFVVHVVRGSDWERPLHEETCGTVAALRSALIRAVRAASSSR